MRQMLQYADNVRKTVAPLTAPEHKSELGQFMTPSSVATFMASLFYKSKLAPCRLLDAGAGVGALSCAFIDRWVSGHLKFKSVDVTAYEIDPILRFHLDKTLSSYSARVSVTKRIIKDDFIRDAANLYKSGEGGFTHAILNPPYKKINSLSEHRRTLREVGIETVNLYSAFVALSVALMASGGQVVAIIPRSFCNGPYYKPFREFLLQRASIRGIHLFDSRSKAFKDDDVLQENIIIHLECGAKQGDVIVTTSTDDTFSDVTKHTQPFIRIVHPNDVDKFIHIPINHELNAIESSDSISYSLEEIDVKVSTGPVVDFRLKEHLCYNPQKGTVPLIYPAHFSDQNIVWPKIGIKKPNAIKRNIDTDKWLYPNGYYCVVRRFSSKEEKRRIVANVIDPATLNNAEVIGLENHLNVYHDGKKGLPELLARGLAVYLNSTAVDDNFRRSSGHTQVNATDLKKMKYPSRKILIALGKWAKQQANLNQKMIDKKMDELTA